MIYKSLFKPFQLNILFFDFINLSVKYLYHSYVKIIKDIVKLGSTGTVKTTKLNFSNFDHNFVARFYEKLSKLPLHNIFIF